MRQRRQEGEHRPQLDEAGSRHVLDGDAVLSDRLHHSRNANARRGVQLQRVAPVGVDVAPDDVAPLKAGDGPHEHASLAHDEIIALDQQKTEISCKVGLLGIGQTQGAWAQDRDPWLRPLASGLEAGAKGPEERRKPLNVQMRIKVGKRLGYDQAVFQSVAAAGRGLRAVAQHPPRAVRAPADVDGVEAQPTSLRRLYASHAGDIINRPRNGRSREIAARDQCSSAVDIVEHALQQLRSLGHAFGNLSPLGLGDQQRHPADRPVALVLFAGYAVGKAPIADPAIRCGEPLPHLARIEGRKRGQHLAPVRPSVAFGVDELVRNAGKGRISPRPSIEPPRGAVVRGDNRRKSSWQASPVVPGCGDLKGSRPLAAAQAPTMPAKTLLRQRQIQTKLNNIN